METITRQQFRQAVREGILSSPSLTTEQCAKLNAVARTALSFGNNYDAGCPADLAGLTPREVDISSAVERFAAHFDHAVMKHAPRYGFVERVKVID